MGQSAFVSVVLFLAAFVWLLAALLQWHNLRKQESILATLARAQPRESFDFGEGLRLRKDQARPPVGPSIRLPQRLEKLP